MSNDPSINTALWNFCMRVNDGPATETADAPERSPEELAWLRQAMESVEMPDKTIKRILTTLHKLDQEPEDPEQPNTQVVEALLDQLDELQELVEDLNCAKEFELMKGCELLLVKLMGKTAATNPDIRRLLLLTMAHASGNLDDLQESFTKLKWAYELVPLLRAENNSSVRAACILACSALCRGSSARSGAEFVNAGGFEAMEEIMQKHSADDPKTVARCLRLGRYFAEQKVSSNGILELAVLLCSHEKQEVIDAAAGLLYTAVSTATSTEGSGAQSSLAKTAATKLGSTIDAWKAKAGELSQEQKELLEVLPKAA